MKKLLTITLLLAIFVPSYAEVQTYESKHLSNKIDNGQIIFRKKLQRKCGFTAAHWASQHTKKEWQTYQSNGAFKEELVKMCPRAISSVKDQWIEPLYLFAVKYAKDTGSRPRC